MATKTVVCPECSEPLPYGRLSCAACGALAASVTGSAPRPQPAAAEGPGALDDGPVPAADTGDEPTPPPAASLPPAPPPTLPGPSPVPAAATAGSAIPYVPAGAYLPPSAVFAPAEEATPAPAAAARPGVAPLLADLPFDAPDDLPGWLVVAGGGLAVVSFLLPWAHRVIGSSGEGSYFNSWGLGAPMHLPVFLLVLLTLTLAMLPNRLAPWLRSGVVPLVVGGLVLGLVWPYVLYEPLAGRLGATAEAVAAFLLVAGGLLSLRLALRTPAGVERT